MRKVSTTKFIAIVIILAISMIGCKHTNDADIYTSEIADNNGFSNMYIIDYTNMSYDDRFYVLQQRFYDAFNSNETQINVSDLCFSNEESDEIFYRLKYENPDYFSCIKDEYIHYISEPSSLNGISWVYIDENFDFRINYIREKTKEIASNINPEWSDLKKAIWINNWICENLSYDNSLVLRDAYDAYTTGQAVCEGFTFIFSMLADECGLQASYAKDRNHVWNVVNIDGEWYHVDLTANIKERKPYRLFLYSDQEYFAIFGKTSDYLCEYECSNNRFDDAFWHMSGFGSMVFIDDIFYMPNGFGIRTFTEDDLKADYFISTKLTDWHDETGRLRGYAFVDITAYKDGFLYNTRDEILYYNAKTKETSLVYQKQENEPHFFGIHYEDGTINIKSYKNFENNEYVEWTIST